MNFAPFVLSHGLLVIFLVLLSYGFSVLQQFLLRHKMPWIWRLGVSIAFVAICMLLFEQAGFAFSTFSLLEITLYSSIACAIFAAITMMNVQSCIALWGFSGKSYLENYLDSNSFVPSSLFYPATLWDRIFFVLALASVLLVIFVMWYVFHISLVSQTGFVLFLKVFTFIHALLALLTSMVYLLCKGVAR